MLTIDELKEFGADTDDGLERCFGNTEFYLRLVKTVPNDANFCKLTEAVNANDLDAAFDAAHALKGSLGNLSLTPIYESVKELTELLRAKTETDYSLLLQKINNQKEILIKLCELQ